MEILSVIIQTESILFPTTDLDTTEDQVCLFVLISSTMTVASFSWTALNHVRSAETPLRNSGSDPKGNRQTFCRVDASQGKELLWDKLIIMFSVIYVQAKMAKKSFISLSFLQGQIWRKIIFVLWVFLEITPFNWTFAAGVRAKLDLTYFGAMER